MFRYHPLIPVFVAAAALVPGTALFMGGIALAPPAQALVSGTAILGAAFLLLWACEAAQADVSQALALAFVALIAVLPEYAVDMYFTWQAGQLPDSDYATFAVANMTGANQLLVGVAWAAVALVFYARTGRPVQLERSRGTEIGFLGLTTLYAFVIPLKGTLAWYDGLVLLGIYGWYIARASGGEVEECDTEGPAEFLVRLPKARRRVATVSLFLLAGGAVLANAKPFCEGLVATGEQFHVNRFLLVQWLAPLASEAPEFTVAIMFALRRRAGLALGSLLSAMLNQWTLLVGMIPGVYGLSHGGFDHPIPMDSTQMDEILMTASQSLLGVALLAMLTLSARQGLLLLALFATQAIVPTLLGQVAGLPSWLGSEILHHFFAAVYVAVALTLLAARARRLLALWQPEPVVRRWPVLPLAD